MLNTKGFLTALALLGFLGIVQCNPVHYKETQSSPVIRVSRDLLGGVGGKVLPEAGAGVAVGASDASKGEDKSEVSTELNGGAAVDLAEGLKLFAGALKGLLEGFGGAVVDLEADLPGGGKGDLQGEGVTKVAAEAGAKEELTADVAGGAKGDLNSGISTKLATEVGASAGTKADADTGAKGGLTATGADGVATKVAAGAGASGGPKVAADAGAKGGSTPGLTDGVKGDLQGEVATKVSAETKSGGSAAGLAGGDKGDLQGGTATKVTAKVLGSSVGSPAALAGDVATKESSKPGISEGSTAGITRKAKSDLHSEVKTGTSEGAKAAADKGASGGPKVATEAGGSGGTKVAAGAEASGETKGVCGAGVSGGTTTSLTGGAKSDSHGGEATKVAPETGEKDGPPVLYLGNGPILLG